MTRLGKRNLNQFAVLWAFSTLDNYSEVKVSSPIQICCRWEFDRSEFLDDTSSQQAVAAELWVDRSIAIGSILWKGKKKDLPSPVTALYQVVEYVEIPGIKARGFERRVLLSRYKESLPTVV